jgi:hypothetical protein
MPSISHLGRPFVASIPVVVGPAVKGINFGTAFP